MPATVLPQWTREGACQPHVCGSACCRFLILEVNPIYLTDADLANWVRLHGVDLAEVEGRTIARIPLPCSALDARGWCLLYNQPERPHLCADFPMTPLALTGIESCSYRFSEGGHDGNCG